MVPITLTDRAANKVRTLLTAQQADGYGLRIDVDLGGCAGYSYKLALAPEASEDEAVVPQDGFDVFVPHAVAPLLEGIRIDYVDTIASSGFTFDNPNASDACGCGNSFSASASAEQNAADAALFGKVEDALEEVRPYLRGDGGDVAVVSVRSGVVSVRLTGACGGWSLATVTLARVIERRLKELLPEVQQVVQVN